ncbi:DUF58 domain-containing protein [Sporosarcina highlanderae]|uniref:DUF58 domain-containing protein n=1 Tax=Sporosarcina highlanderae TaxID=3035916 RepID=A0ABT8JUZ1_9BACL|nr:DUF58 domain-containing protein [Sporosarcina highlanderae]MDN4608955.1 DUF58 domain-containing protein [Sporosarcina highlanderae]
MKGELFPDRLAKRLGALSISTKSRRLGHHKGAHRSSKTGSSLDFSDFREYHPGDDLRHIDWNVFARTDKPFIKQFLDEQEMRVHILLDSTKSMSTDGKWNFARQIAIGFGHIALKSGDTVSFSTYNTRESYFFRKKGALHRASLSKFISKLDNPSSTMDFADHALKHIPKAVTVLLIITDGLEQLDKWEKLFRRLPGICKDIRIVTVHSAQEEIPTYEGDVRLVDIENESVIEVSMTKRIVEDYTEKKRKHETQLTALANKYGIRLLRTETSEGVMDLFTKKMRQVGWLQ